MALKIRRTAVLGAGVMGAQIAAVLAAAGVRVHLLDLTSAKPPQDPKLAKVVGENVRSSLAILALEKLKQLKPPPLYTQSYLANIIPGNFDDDLSVLVECDWIIEAVVERIDIKQNIHHEINKYLKPGVPVTTNTSGINLAEIVEDLPEHYQEAFFGTHFFNPPRYMHLVEIIPHETTNQEMMAQLTAWLMHRLGKGIVFARDTVNFIANRIGVFANQATLRHMAELGLNVETVDALTGKAMGRPSSATLRTMDVVGLDTFRMVAQNTYDRAPDDPYRDWFLGPDWVEDLIKAGRLGQKSGDGCYQKSKDETGRRVILAYRPETQSYAKQDVASFPWQKEAAKQKDTIQRLKLIIEQKDPGAELIWRTLRDTMAYAAWLLEEIADGLPKPVDDALRWGFNWEWGPFELWQALGFDFVIGRMKEEGVSLPSWIEEGIDFYQPVPGSLPWQMEGGASEQFCVSRGEYQTVPKAPYAYHLPKFENKKDQRTVLSNRNVSLIDIGRGIACLNFHSKMNSVDESILELTHEAVAKVRASFDAMIVANEGPHFCVGANLQSFLEKIQAGDWNGLDQMIRAFQGATQMIKFAPFPTVACPHGYTLGGGCEYALQTTQQWLAAETYSGLVEVGVGVIPAAGGTKELALRAYSHMKVAERGDPMPFLQHAFKLIGMGKVSTSGFDAVEIGLYPPDAHVSISKGHLVERAKFSALQMVQAGYVPKSPVQNIKAVGDPGIQTFRMMLYNMVEGNQITSYDAYMGTQVATVLCGGDVDAGTIVSEQHFLDLERRVFIECCKQPKTVERIEHMLKTGKALRN